MNYESTYLQYLYTDIDEPVNVQSQLHQIEQERHVLLHGQIVGIPGGERIEHFDHGDATLPRHHVLIEIAQALALLGGGFEVELVPRVFFDLK